MARLSLPHRVAKTIEEGRGCLFIEMYLALKGWSGRTICANFGGA